MKDIYGVLFQKFGKKFKRVEDFFIQ